MNAKEIIVRKPFFVLTQPTHSKSRNRKHYKETDLSKIERRAPLSQ